MPNERQHRTKKKALGSKFGDTLATACVGKIRRNQFVHCNAIREARAHSCGETYRTVIPAIEETTNVGMVGDVNARRSHSFRSLIVFTRRAGVMHCSSVDMCFEMCVDYTRQAQGVLQNSAVKLISRGQITNLPKI